MENRNIFLIPTAKNPIKGGLILRHIWKGTPMECKSLWQFNEDVDIDNTRQYTTLNGSFRDVYTSFVPQYLHITLDEDIEDGEYGICLSLVREGLLSHQAVFKMDAEQRQAMEELGGRKKAEVLKVILTTDPELIKDGVQAVPNEFLEWFVKNLSCEYVEITKVEDLDLYYENGIGGKKYKIIIAKEEPFKHTSRVIPTEEILANRCSAYEFIDFDEIEKQVRLTEARGEKIVKYLDKYKGQSIYNEIALAIEFGYQLKSEEDEVIESIEEIAFKLFPDKSYWIGSGNSARLHDPNYRDREMWIQGAKFKAERGYTDEDMIEASKYGYNFHKTTQFPEQEFEDSCIRNTQQWLTTFKKKKP